MGKATSVSVTEAPCSCGYLARSAKDPNSPVQFNPKLQEYFFEHVLAHGTKVETNLYHCPMCGGVASASIRDAFFAELSEVEIARLDAELTGLTTLQEVLKELGPPDNETSTQPPSDVVIVRPLSGKREFGVIRVLTYSRLSDTADVHFTVYSDGTFESSIGAKYLSRTPNP